MSRSSAAACLIRRLDPLHRFGRLPRRLLALGAAAAAMLLGVGKLQAYGPQGFDTVIIDAGHGGVDRGGGPGQRIPEKPYTLDSALRLESALRRRGFRTVMTRRNDVFVPLRDRVAIANSFRNAIFVSVHYNSGQREEAHGYETYYYRSDSFGLAARLHQAQLASMYTEDRHVRRRGFYVVRNTAIPSVLCEGGFLTNAQESSIILSAAYRQRWAENIANAIAEQSRSGDPRGIASQPQPPVTSERLVSSGRSGSSSRRSVSHRGSSSRRSASARRGGSRRSSARSSRSSRTGKKSPPPRKRRR